MPEPRIISDEELVARIQNLLRVLYEEYPGWRSRAELWGLGVKEMVLVDMLDDYFFLLFGQRWARQS